MGQRETSSIRDPTTSQVLHPTSQVPSDEAKELVNKIDFQKYLLTSIDDSVQNRETAENEVEGEIRKLESQLRALTHNTTTGQLVTSTYNPLVLTTEVDTERMKGSESYVVVLREQNTWMVASEPSRPVEDPQRRDINELLKNGHFKSFRAESLAGYAFQEKKMATANNKSFTPKSTNSPSMTLTTSEIPSPTPIFRDRWYWEWWKSCKCNNWVDPAQHATTCTCSHDLCDDCQPISPPPTPIRD
jgi:hypothetical protein